jgi:hypothetical protein
LIEVETIDADSFEKVTGFAKVRPKKSSNDPRVDDVEPAEVGPDISGSPAAA